MHYALQALHQRVKKPTILPTQYLPLHLTTHHLSSFWRISSQFKSHINLPTPRLSLFKILLLARCILVTRKCKTLNVNGLKTILISKLDNEAVRIAVLPRCALIGLDLRAPPHACRCGTLMNANDANGQHAFVCIRSDDDDRRTDGHAPDNSPSDASCIACMASVG